MDIILSAAKANLTDADNTRRHLAMSQTLDALGIPWTYALGVFEGIKENSFFFKDIPPSQANTLMRLARAFDQDCILFFEGLEGRLKIMRGGHVPMRLVSDTLVDTLPDASSGDFTALKMPSGYRILRFKPV